VRILLAPHGTRGDVQPIVEPVARASEGCELIVGAGLQFAAASVAQWRSGAVAQWRRVPYAHVVFCPCATPNSATPPPNVHRQTLPRWINRLLWQAGGPVADLALRGPINRGRATLGLGALDSPISQILQGRTILAADRDLGPLPDDAPKSAVSTDAVVLDEPGTLDARVEAFLQQGPAPIYIGFGSMIAPRARELVVQVVAAVRAVGRRAVIAGGWASLERHIIEADDVLTVDNVPHSQIFPRVAAAVHHGGAGTTTAAARAGVPQVLLPHILDQYYWAHRVEVLGLGPRALPIERVTVDVLCDRISRAVNDPLIRERVNRLAPTVAARNGVTAAEHFEAAAI
jgi:vancomycin aglycone glucosyltransferase